MINWYNDDCEFGLANLNPCHPITLQRGIFVLWCQDMLAECVVRGLDGYYDLSSYHLATTLTADEAAPPYSPGPC